MKTCVFEVWQNAMEAQVYEMCAFFKRAELSAMLSPYGTHAEWSAMVPHWSPEWRPTQARELWRKER